MPTNTFKVGEMLNKRTINSKTWINFDGSYTTEIHTGDVHFNDENGNLQNINTDLIDEADMDIIDIPVANEGKERFYQAKKEVVEAKKKGILNREKHNFQGLFVPFDCHIPRNFMRGYTVGKGLDKLTFKPVKASPSTAALSENNRSVVTYQDVWNDADVELKILTVGIKETIWLKTNKSPTSFSFEVIGPLADDLTAGQLKLAPAWLRDAQGIKRDVSQTVRRENGKVYVDLVADVTNLVYPIEIDPTVTVTGAAHDAYVTSDFPDTNYNNEHLLVGSTSQSLIQFDLSDIPQNIDVTSARIFLRCNSLSNSPTIDFYNVLSSWGETTVTHNTLPSHDSTPSTSNLSVVSGNQWFTITQTVKNIYTREIGNHGFLIKRNNTSGSARFNSSEALSDVPQIEVTYNHPPTAPTVTAPNGGETWNSLHTITWKSGQDLHSTINTGFDSADNVGATVTTTTTQRAQRFLTPNVAGTVKKLSAKFNDTVAGNTFRASIYNVNQTDNLPTTEVYGQDFSFPNTVTGETTVELEFTNTVELNANIKYAVVYTRISSDFIVVLTDDNTYQDGQSYYYNGSWNAIAYDDKLKIHYYTSNLQHNIQLTTDDGVNWKDIVSLTTAGVTSYDYDFINEPESSTCLVRIRAYDGTSYGNWDQSDGVFTIQHNSAPSTPTNLSPSGTSQDRAQVVRLSWQHNDVDGDPQSKFDLHWRLQGNTTWNTVTQITTNQYWDAPAGTFPKGTIEWQVRTYDQADLSSPYSAIVTFYAGDKPANPTITEPADASTVSVANPTVQWSSSGQVAYHLKVLDINSNLLWEVNKTSTNKAQTVQYDLVNNTDYKISLAIKNSDGLWSSFVTHSIYVSYTPPAKAIVVTGSDAERGYISLTIDNPTPSGTEPNVNYNNIFRRESGETEWMRIVTNFPIDKNYIDYTVTSGKTYEYQIRAWGDNGTYSDSDVVSGKVVITNAQIARVLDYNIYAKFTYKTNRNERSTRTHSVNHFAGRRLPVAEFGDSVLFDFGTSFLVSSDIDMETLRFLADSGETLLYRDSRGRRFFVVITDIKVDDEYSNYYDVNLSMMKVDYEEEV